MEGTSPQPQGGGKKKKNKKKTTLTLDQFLEQPTFTKHSTSTSWADESEAAAADGRYSEPAAVDYNALPKGPRASYGPSAVDLGRLPQRPPFVAYVGNLPYDITAEDIYDFFKVDLVGVRLPTEGGGRIKGFGYAEFHSKNELAEALKLNGESLKNRRLKVDLASNNDDGRGGPGGHREFDEDRTTGDWRSGPPARDNYEPGPQRGGDRFGGDRYDGGDRFDSRGGDRYDSRGGDRYDSRGGDRYDGGRGGDHYDGGRGDRYDSSGGSDRYGSRGGDRDERFGGRGGGRMVSPSRADQEDNWRRGPPPGRDSRDTRNGEADNRGEDRAGPYRGSDRQADSSPSRPRDKPSSSTNGADSASDRGDFRRDDRNSRGPSRERDADRRPASRSPGRHEGGRPERGPGEGYDDRGPSHDNDRGSSRYDDRGPIRHDDRGAGRLDDRGSSRYDDRGSSRYDSRGPARYDDRSTGGRYDDRSGGGRYDDRSGGRYDDRSGGGRYDDRSGGRYDDRGSAGGRYDDRSQGSRYDDRGSGSRYNAPRDRDGSRYDGPPQRHDDERRSSRDTSPRPAAERPRLNLQKRTKPVEATGGSENKNSASIFGGARPVDTAARERELEKKRSSEKIKPVEREHQRGDRNERSERPGHDGQSRSQPAEQWRSAAPASDGNSKAARDSDPEEDGDWETAGNKKSSQSRSVQRGGSRDGGRDDRGSRDGGRDDRGSRDGGRDDRGSRGGGTSRRDDSRPAPRSNVVPANPPSKPAWGKPSAQPAVEEKKVEISSKSRFDALADDEEQG